MSVIYPALICMRKPCGSKLALPRNSTQVTHSVSFMRWRIIWGRVFTVDRSFQPARLLLDFISTPTTPKAHDSGKKTHTDKNLLLVNDNTV